MTDTEIAEAAPHRGMRMVVVAAWGWGCCRCDHEWVPRNTTREPKVCPKCKSPYWNTPRRTQQRIGEKR
jgi:predicted Zn-ribbon and HTH transcriptional regulator